MADRVSLVVTSSQLIDRLLLYSIKDIREPQLLSAVENPTSTTALKRSPYLMVNQRSLKRHENIISWEGDFAYPKPSHAKSALAVLVTATPYASIIGKVPEATIDIKKERNALILMLAMYHRKNLSLPTCSQLSPQHFWNASGQQDKQQMD